MWYENGRLQSETNFKNGQNEGLMKSWDEQGQLRYEAIFKDGRENGLTILIGHSALHLSVLPF